LGGSDRRNPGSAPSGYAGRRIRRLCPVLATMNRSVNGVVLPARSVPVQQAPMGGHGGSKRLSASSRMRRLGNFMRKAAASLLCVFLLAGCASTTSTMLSADTAMVSASGNGPSDRDRVVRDALSEAARVTSAHGYRYFVVLTADDATIMKTVVIPGRVLYNQPPRASEAFGAYVGRAYAAGGSNYMTPDRKLERIRPGMDMIIRMYRAGEIEPSMEGVWDATASLSPMTASR
jgi:hypothetical protein